MKWSDSAEGALSQWATTALIKWNLQRKVVEEKQVLALPVHEYFSSYDSSAHFAPIVQTHKFYTYAEYKITLNLQSFLLMRSLSTSIPLSIKKYYYLADMLHSWYAKIS